MFGAMRPLAIAAAAALVVGCGGGESVDELLELEEGGAPVEQTRGVIVPDSIIEQDLLDRITSDPRLAHEDVAIEVHSTDGEVILVGQVPTRLEMSIAREIASSVPGVERVYLDSLLVITDAVGESAPVSES